MRAAVLEAPGRIRLVEVPVPEPGPGELVVRIEAALTCGTDLKTIRRGHPLIRLPAPLGHEFSGVVAMRGAGVDAFREGDPVACVPTSPCRVCRACVRGRESLCERAVAEMAFGAFADYIRLPARLVATNVFARPASMDAETAALLEPLACVVHGVSRAPAGDAETVLLIGDGPIALLFLQRLRLAGVPRVLVAGRHEARLAAGRALGAEVFRAPDPHSAAAEARPAPRPTGAPRAVRPAGPAGGPLEQFVADWTGGAGADIVIECVGTAATWELAVSLVAAGGTALLYGGCPAGERVCLDAFPIHYREVDVRGAFHYDRAAVRDALELLRSGGIDAAPLITHRLPLSELDAALALAACGDAIKVAVRP